MSKRLPFASMLVGLGVFSASFVVNGAERGFNPQVTKNLIDAPANGPIVDIFDYVSPTSLPLVPLSSNAGYLRAIGLAQSPKRPGFANAFLVYNCYALTNYHVAFDYDHGEQPSTNATVNIGLGLYANGKFQTTRTAHPISGGWPELPKGKLTCKDDWTIVRLDNCDISSSEFGYLRMNGAATDRIADAPISMAGYNGRNGYFRGVTYEKKCPSGLATPSGPDGNLEIGVIQHFCSEGPGSSGSPITLQDLDGSNWVVGMNCGHAGAKSDGVVSLYDRTRLNVAVSIASIRERVQRAIELDASRAPARK